MSVGIDKVKSDHSSFLSSFTNILSKTINGLGIIASEAFAVITSVCPAIIRWSFRKYISGDIKTYSITADKVNDIAYLNSHGKIEDNDSIALFLHGDHSHPLTMLHLADLAKQKKMTVFSLYIPKCHEDKFDSDNSLIENAIKKIEQIVQIENLKIKAVGHSKGAILLAKNYCTQDTSKIHAACAIAGRLKVPEDKIIPEDLESFYKQIKTIETNIVQKPKLAIVQIIPQDDWMVPQTEMGAANRNCNIVHGMHLSVLFETETYDLCSTFLNDKT